MNIEAYQKILAKVNSYNATLVAVSKTKPNEDLEALYHQGQRVFGENKVQEMCNKHESLSGNYQWHMIGHLQRNKVKYMANFVSLVHGVDSLQLLKELNKQGAKNERVISCLLQVHIAKETTKFGFNYAEVEELISNNALIELCNVEIIGLMGMATNTDDSGQVRSEFKKLNSFFENCRSTMANSVFNVLSMGMSGDYEMALDEGSNMVRIGSLIFGDRNYDN
ncbi:MAG: YggS family pyridoxal phosphate-dependent enzyme [Bacteroidetes bacterium]|nr:YggS family pyridoxal phosphate-dependent enzyme [Bacteroidota bacterium]